MQVFERKTSRSTKRNSITMSARRSFTAKNIAFSGRGKILDRFLGIEYPQCVFFADVYSMYDFSF